MSEIRIILDHNPESPDRLPTAEHAAQAGIWCAKLGHYASAAAFLALAQALEVDGYAQTVALAGRDVVAVPMVGQTRSEHPRTNQTKHAEPHTYATATCCHCGAVISAYGYQREAIEVTRDPALGGPGYREWMPGMAEFTDWRHDPERIDSDHDAVPIDGSVVGPLTSERGVGRGEH